MAEKKRGFAAMDSEKQRQIASKGGKAAHAKGTAHQFTPEEAREAGRKGGQAAHAKGTAHQFTPEEARAAGRKGGQSSHRNNPHRPGDEGETEGTRMGGMPMGTTPTGGDLPPTTQPPQPVVMPHREYSTPHAPEVVGAGTPNLGNETAGP